MLDHAHPGVALHARAASPGWPPPRGSDRLRFLVSRAADFALVGAAFVLPWSTSGLAILLGAWVLCALPTVGLRAVLNEVRHPAAGLPVALWLAAVAGVMWTDASWADAFRALRPFHKLLAIPLLLAHLRVSRWSDQIALAFLISCVVLLCISWAQAQWPALAIDPARSPGIPVKDRIVQGVEFAICGAALLAFAAEAVRRRSFPLAASAAAIGSVFLINVVAVAATRTGAVLIAALLALVGWRVWRWRGLAGLLFLALLAIGSAVVFSPTFRERFLGTATEIAQYEGQNPLTSTGLRLDYWRQAIQFVDRAPLIGNGTGSTQRLSEHLAQREQLETSVIIPENPHNQILAVAIQLGLFGTVFLCAMWIAHWRLFLGSGLWSLLGAIVVAQNIIASLFNSHLFDVTPGWIYVIGVSVLAALAEREGLWVLSRTRA